MSNFKYFSVWFILGYLVLASLDMISSVWSALVITIIYAIISWYLYGKDPAPCPVVPNWEPPKNLTPLECAIIDSDGEAPKNMLITHLMWLACKKIITLKREKKEDHVFYRATVNKNSHPEDRESRLFYRAYYINDLIIDEEPDEMLTNYLAGIKEAICKKLEGVYYYSRLPLSLLCTLFFPSVLGFYNCQNSSDELIVRIGGLLFLFLLGGVLFPIGIFLISQIFSFIGQFLFKLHRVVYQLIWRIILLLPSWSLIERMPYLIWPCLVYIVVSIFFANIIFQPTRYGQRQKEKIAGLKMFLSAIVASNVSISNPEAEYGLSMEKRLTPEDIKNLFPYAVAFGLEKQWQRKFKNILNDKEWIDNLPQLTSFMFDGLHKIIPLNPNINNIGYSFLPREDANLTVCDFLFCLIKFIACLIICFPISVNAAEIIENFHSDITINQDGSLTIKETIRVHHEGKQIRRGIYRDLATTKGEYYKILSVTRDDFPEPWFTERKDTALRLNTGDNELLPSPATSTFELEYVMYDALRTIRGENLNELYLNVTGKWAFPMDKVEVDVHYPEETQVVRQYAYLTGHNPRQLPNGSTFVFDAVPAGFEVTIAQAFTQGTVDIHIAKIYKTLIVALMVTLLYYLIMWVLFGKDPQSQPVVPDWEVPADLSPLDCAILNKQGAVPHDAFFIHVIWLLSQKILTMKITKHAGLFGADDTYELMTDADIAAKQKNQEINLYLKNFPNFLRLTKNPSQKVSEYCDNLVAKTLEKLNKKYYNRHGLITFFGALIFPSVWVMLFPENAGLLLWCLMWGLGIFIGIMQKDWVHVVPFIVVFIPIVGLLLGFNIYNVAMFVIYCALIYAFNYLMFQPTFIGQRQIEKIEGLKMFLEAVTANQNISKSDKRVTPEDMDQLFPYAVALGLEKAWCKKYEKIFGAASLAKMQSSHMYYNTDMRANFNNCCARVSSYTQSNGTGSFGGGHAGGGFGGGGGGGR